MPVIHKLREGRVPVKVYAGEIARDAGRFDFVVDA